MTVIFALAVLFAVKHFVCDFVLQSDRMLQEKGTYGATGGLAHAGIHAVGTAIILFAVLPWSLSAHLAAIALGALDGIVHYHIDWAKIKINVHKNLTPADREFWTWLGLDQMLHYLTYVALVAILTL